MECRRETIAALRVRNEERWIAETLRRLYEVVEAVFLLDDGSSDDTVKLALSVLDRPSIHCHQWGFFASGRCASGRADLHVLYSPFRLGDTPYVVGEGRDRQLIFDYALARRRFSMAVFLDGDEWLSRALIRAWPDIVARMRRSYDLVYVPFLYLWDSVTTYRADGVYARIRAPILFNVERLGEDEIRALRFPARKFHVGRVPVRESGSWRFFVAVEPVLHLGYLDAAMRQAKYDFYTREDPNNHAEGNYLHIIGRPNHLAPGPVVLKSYVDE